MASGATWGALCCMRWNTNTASMAPVFIMVTTRSRGAEFSGRSPKLSVLTRVPGARGARGEAIGLQGGRGGSGALQARGAGNEEGVANGLQRPPGPQRGRCSGDG